MNELVMFYSILNEPQAHSCDCIVFHLLWGKGKTERVGAANLTKLEVSNLVGQFLFCFSVSIAHKFKWSLSNGFRFLESKDIAIFLDKKHAMRSVFPLHLKTQAASFSSHTASGN